MSFGKRQLERQRGARRISAQPLAPEVVARFNVDPSVYVEPIAFDRDRLPMPQVRVASATWSPNGRKVDLNPRVEPDAPDGCVQADSGKFAVMIVGGCHADRGRRERAEEPAVLESEELA